MQVRDSLSAEVDFRVSAFGSGDFARACTGIADACSFEEPFPTGTARIDVEGL